MINLRRAWPLLLALLASCTLWPPTAHGQGGVLQSGTVVVGDCVKWAANGIVSDAGTACAASTTPGGSNGQVQYNNAGAFGAFTLGGDCTLTASTGVILCTKTSGTAFGSLATLGHGVGLTTSGSNLIIANPSASTLGGIESYAAVTHQFINAISTAGVPSSAQPAFTDISGQATLAQLPSIANSTVIGNVSGITTIPTALTATQLTTLCNAVTSTLSGCAPLSGGGTTNFLRADGTWANPQSSTPTFNSILGGVDPFTITGTTAGAVTIGGGTSALGNPAGALNLNGGTAGGSGLGGAVNIAGGNSTSTSAAGAINITSGTALASASAGAINLAVGTSNAANGAAVTVTAGAGNGGTASGGNVNLVGGAAVSTGQPGEVQVNGNSSLICGTYYFTGTPAATNQVFFLATRPMRVKTISEIHSTAAGGTSTLTVTKDTSTNAPGSGTSLHQSGSFNLNATANTVQNASVVTTIATANMAAGDRLAVVFANAIQSTVGVVVTACMVPI